MRTDRRQKCIHNISPNVTPTGSQKWLEDLRKVFTDKMTQLPLEQGRKFFRLLLKAALERPKEDRKWVVLFVQQTCEQMREHLNTEHRAFISVRDVLEDDSQEEGTRCMLVCSHKRQSIFSMALKTYDEDARKDRYESVGYT